VLVWKRVDEIESRYERQTDGQAVNREISGQNRKTVYVFYSYFVHLVLRGLFVITSTILQHTYFYPNGFDFKFSCNLPPTDQVTSNINTPKNGSRNLNGTLVTCENATASEKWVLGISVSVINSIVAAVILWEVIYLLPRLPMLNRHTGVGRSSDSKFVIEYLLGKNAPDESEPLISIENNPPHCSTQDYSTPDSVAQACSTMNNSIQDSRDQDTPDSIAQECTTMDHDIQDSGTEDCIDVYKKQVLNRSRDPGIIYGPNANIDELYIDLVIHTERAQHKFLKEMNRHEIYDVYMKVPPKSIRLEKIRDLFYPNEDTKGKFPHSILAVGRPGIGKTVLTKKILHDWANGIDEYYSDRIVFFFKLRWFNKDINELTNFSLKTFLRFGTGLSEENFESIYEEIEKNPQKAILIFDGLDEYHGDPISCLDQSHIIPNDPDTGTSAINLFIKLVLGDLLKGATVVVTSRSTADDFYSRLDFDRNVEIIGFTFDKIEEYISRFCNNNNMSYLKTKIWNHIKSSPELLNLCYIPVNCFIVCATLSGCLSDPRNETGALPTTLTELYQTAIDHFEKYHHRNADRNSTAHEALKNIQQLAFLGMESGQLVFDQTLFDEEMKTSGLLNSLSNPIFPLQTQFCFIHLTIQEFFAARHVTETLTPAEIKKFISDHVKSGKWHLVLQFIAGLLGKKIKNFDEEHKDCVFAFAESLEVTDGEIIVKYHEVFIMKCLSEADNEEITKEVCETTVINDIVELLALAEFYNLSPSEWVAVTFICKHMKRLENLRLFGFAADSLPEVLGLLRKRCLNKLEMGLEGYYRAATDEIDQVFSALMELNCTFDHEHTKLTLTLEDILMTKAGLLIMCNFFENGHASQLEQFTLNLNGIGSHEISKVCEVLNNGHCPNLTHLHLGHNLIRDEGVIVLCDTLTKGLRKLNTLDVCKCWLTDRCIPTLVKALQDERCQLTDLSLEFNDIGDESACMLFQDALKNEHCKLTKLNVESCLLTGQCIPSLCKALQDERCQLTGLSLACNLIDDKDACMLFKDALTKEHCKLTALNLCDCLLTDQCIPSLCKALQDEHCQLTDLSLGNNAIGDKGACMLFEDVLTKEHCKLTALNLDRCPLTDQCIPSLCKALKDGQCVLTILFLLSNHFTENGKKLLRDTMNYESCKARGLQIVV
jgi:Ran GTPase-activating protein (RanGAP) involved in mRNA processing and transport